MARQFRASIDLGTNQIKNVVDPTAAQDAATKAYVDSVVNGLVYKKECRAATTAALATVVYANGASGVGATLTGASVGALGAIDGITLAVGERLLVKNQVDQTQNGAYTVTATGSGVAVFVLTRATDSDMAADYASGAAYYIVEGTINGNTTWAMSTEPPITMGTTSIAFAQVDGPGSTLAGNGLSRSGNTISIDTAITATVNNPTFTGTTTAPEFSASGLTGATSASRYVGATATGSPASGTFVIGDFVIARDGHVWICIVGGSPGAWADVALQGSSDVQAFSANGTWTKQANAVWVEVIVVGSGGGGGGGRLGGAAGIRGGGGGGGPGQVIREEFQAADLTATVAVTIPAGGTAGVGRSGAVNSGGAGGTPAATTFGAFMSAAGGVGGGGGTGAAGGAGGAAGGNTFTPSWVSQGAGAVGATGGVGAGISAGGGGVAGAPGAGGAGGGMSAANAIDNGSAGGGGGGVDGTNAAKLAGGAGGSGAGAAGTAGTASGTSPSSSLTGGSGGGGGAAGSGASNATGGGAGQNGGTWGAGGGGGGAGTSNGTTGTSGAGGTGGKGYVIVISHR